MAAISPTNPIPALTTSMVGREADLQRLVDLVLRPDVSLVTLLGTGGVGKTRLALQLAHDLDEAIVGDIHVVFLANASDAEAVLPAIARVVGVAQSGTGDLTGHLIDAIGDRRCMIVLDNLDQVAHEVRFLPKLLASCPGLKVVATSQVMLRLSAERVFPVEPLSTQGSGSGQRSPAADLFVDRALAVNPGFDLSPASIRAVERICKQVDGLPLAIELAAARTRFLSAQPLSERLSERLRLLTGGPLDAPERHRTLRALLTWSHDLLTSDERILFRRLAIFEPGGPFDAIEPVCNAAGDLGGLAEDILASLVDHSLVRVFDTPATGTRVRMLNTVREFAREQLRVSGEETAIRQAHSAWFAAHVNTTPTETWRTGTETLVAWTARNLPDVDNFSLAIADLLDRDDRAAVLPMVTYLVPFWLEIGQLSECAKWTEQVMPFAGEAPDPVQSTFFRMAAAIWMSKDRLDEAIAFGTRAVEIAERTGDYRLLANSQNLLGQVYWRSGDAETGQRWQLAAIESVERDPDAFGGALFSVQMAEWLVDAGDLDRAETLLRNAIEPIAANRPGAMPFLQGTMADLMLRRGNLDESGQWLERSLDYHLEPPHRLPSMLAGRLLSASHLALRRGDLERAARLVGNALAICHRLGLSIDASTRATIDQVVTSTRDRLGNERADDLIQAGKQESMQEALASAIAACRMRQLAAPSESTEPGVDSDLTPREREVLALLAEGLSNGAIADALSISERTVTTHLSRLYAKLDVSTRTEAISLAMRTGLTTPAGRT